MSTGAGSRAKQHGDIPAQHAPGLIEGAHPRERYAATLVFVSLFSCSYRLCRVTLASCSEFPHFEFRLRSSVTGDANFTALIPLDDHGAASCASVDAGSVSTRLQELLGQLAAEDELQSALQKEIIHAQVRRFFVLS